MSPTLLFVRFGLVMMTATATSTRTSTRPMPMMVVVSVMVSVMPPLPTHPSHSFLIPPIHRDYFTLPLPLYK